MAAVYAQMIWLVRGFFILAFALGVLYTPNRATAADTFIYEVTVKKQEKKQPSKWSLSEWLETKNRMRLMDMWLSFHTPSPFEFYLGGAAEFGQRNHDQSYLGGQFHAAAFATMFGLEFQKEHSAANITNTLFHWRLFGLHNQTTNITLHGGLRFRGNSFEHRSPVAGVTTAIYITKYVGIDGTFRQIFQSSANTLGTKISGKRYEVGPFIDFKFVRIFGNYFHEQEFANSAAMQESYPIRSGYSAGLRFFF